MAEDNKVMGIPELIHYNTLAVTGSLFIGIIAFKFGGEKVGWNNLPLTLFVLALALALLVISADLFIKGAKGLAQRAEIPEVVIGLTVVSIGTSLPEIVLTSISALDSVNNPGLANFAISGIFGSILVQITLILGVVVLFRGMKIRPSWLKRDGLIMLLSLLLLSFFIYTGYELNRIEGLILVLLYVAYVSWLLLNRKVIREDELIDKSLDIEATGSNWTTAAYIVMITLGLSFAVFAAQHLVSIANDLAKSMNIPHSTIGSTISGFGTSLPELTIALMAARKSEGVAIGTLIGSNITDPLLSIGIAALISPLAITSSEAPELLHFIIPTTIIGSTIAIFMMWTQYEFKRWEGLVLILFYLTFLAVLAAEYLEYISF
ncbi:MAG: calcium/sodium antiporter [archaeon]|nr:calcium/sodium antiporter [archaeon]